MNKHVSWIPTPVLEQANGGLYPTFESAFCLAPLLAVAEEPE